MTGEPGDGTLPLSAAEKAVWRAFLSWSEAVTALVGREITTATGLSVPDFEILVRLYEAPGRALPQRRLLDSLGWSASRLSHQLARMERRGLLTRTEVGTGRLMSVALSPAGEQQTGTAVLVQAAALRAHFFSGLRDAGRQALLEMGHDKPD